MKYPDRPLVQALQDFHKKNPVSFHVPGHKHGVLSRLPEAMRHALAYDMTELTGLDDLHEPLEAIRQAEDKLSALYGSDRSFFLVNGSTVGNLAMLYATVGPGDLVIVQRNAHKSIFHALELTGARPVFLSPEWHEPTQSAGTVSMRSVDYALATYPDVQAAVFTTPTYYGVVNEEMERIIEACHKRCIPVLVDEAHGAHFIVNDAFPKSALELGADVVVHSAHKTLPAMTMASFLHIRSRFVKVERVAHYLQLLQSSSPSYLLMASLDDARYYAETYTEQDYQALLEYRRIMVQGLREIRGIEVVEPDDGLKLLVRATGHTGFDLQRSLEQQNVYVELADLYHVLLVLPLVKAGHEGFDTDIRKKFQAALTAVADEGTTAARIDARILAGSPASAVYTASQLHGMDTEWLDLWQAQGRVVAEAIIPYPPGIPTVCAGERLVQEQIGPLLNLLEAGCKFQGALDAVTKQVKVIAE